MCSSVNTILQSNSNISELIRSGIMNCNENVNCCLIALGDKLTLTKITYTHCSFDWWVFLRRQRSNFVLKNTIDNQSCICDAIESTTNLYYTDQYSALRRNTHQSKLQFGYVLLISVSL
jgi:hypothetical protein